MDTWTAFTRTLTGRQEACLTRAAALRADGRGDEAALERIRANIFEIMATVARTAQARFPHDPAPFFREKLASVPAAWRAAQAAAEAHGDHTKAEIERIKLAAAAEVEAAFAAWTEGGS